MSNKEIRETKEMKNLFDDPKFARKAWRSIGAILANRPAARMPIIVDKDGNETIASQLDRYTYTSLCEDLKSLNSDRTAPTELEMILACQFIKARTDTAAATFIRDTCGAKPVDESKVDTNVNMFETLTDEELELLAQHRAAKEAESSPTPTAERTIVDNDK